MLFRNTTMSSSDYRLGVRDNAMNPRQKHSRSFGITKDYFAVGQTLILRNPPIGSPSVGPDCLQHLPSFRCSWPTAEPFQKTLNGCSRRIFHHPHMGKPWSLSALLIPIKRNGTQNSALPFASAASFLPLAVRKTTRPSQPNLQVGIEHLCLSSTSGFCGPSTKQSYNL